MQPGTPTKKFRIEPGRAQHRTSGHDRYPARRFSALHPGRGSENLEGRESWLRTKAAARAIPCTFLGKHLRFSDIDIAQIKAKGARKPTHRGAGTTNT
jgi:hypothetical protein